MLLNKATVSREKQFYVISKNESKACKERTKLFLIFKDESAYWGWSHLIRRQSFYFYKQFIIHYCFTFSLLGINHHYFLYFNFLFIRVWSFSKLHNLQQKISLFYFFPRVVSSNTLPFNIAINTSIYLGNKMKGTFLRIVEFFPMTLFLPLFICLYLYLGRAIGQYLFRFLLCFLKR